MDTSVTDCARARETVSADLDGELQELEIRRLQAHLRHCADCATWAERTRATTTELRESAREAPAAVAFGVPRRVGTWRVGVALAVGSAAALAATAVISLSGAQHGLRGGQRAASSSVYVPSRWLAPDVDVYMPLMLRHQLQAV